LFLIEIVSNFVSHFMNLQMDLPVLTHPEFNESKLKSKGVSLIAFCDNIRKRKDDTCTIRIRIIHNRFPKYYTTRINLTEIEYKKMCGPKPRVGLKENKAVIYELLKRVHDVIIDIPEFSFKKFDKIFLRKEIKNNHNVFDWYEDKINELKADNKLSSLDTYDNSMKSLKDFIGREVLSFEKVTPEFLKKYEQWMLNKNRSISTIGIYLRPLRHIYNRALNDDSNFLNDHPYPFAVKGGYTIQAPRNIKKALSKEDLKKIFLYSAQEGSQEHFYRDIWLFSYLCNGINIKDICLLKYDNIKVRKIEFYRAKTKSLYKEPKKIEIVITNDVQNIIDRWGTKPVAKMNYIFPFFKKGLSPGKKHAIVKQTTKQCNKYIRCVAENVGIEHKISTYWARHTYATILKRAGVSSSFIGDSLGHSSPDITDKYLGSFEDEQRESNVANLTDWD
jgi:integrase/recombinase XerD